MATNQPPPHGTQTPKAAPAAQAPQPTALVPVETSTTVMAMVPTTFDGAMQVARWLAQSTLLPKSVNREFDIFFVITAGMEVGIPPMAALRSLYVVNGRTALESRAKMALCLSKGAAQYFKRVEYTPEATTWETLRHGQSEPVRMRYTLKEAIAAYLAPGPNPDGKGPAIAGKEGPWRLYTQRMISHRALGWICDDVYPDVVLGIATAEDFDQNEFTFRPITPGVDLLDAAPRQAPAPQPAAANSLPPPQSSQPTSSTRAAAVAAPQELSEDDIIEVITKIGQFGTETSLKQFAKENIHGRVGEGPARQRILNAYEAQLEQIRSADKAGS